MGSLTAGSGNFCPFASIVLPVKGISIDPAANLLADFINERRGFDSSSITRLTNSMLVATVSPGPDFVPPLKEMPSVKHKYTIFKGWLLLSDWRK